MDIHFMYRLQCKVLFTVDYLKYVGITVLKYFSALLIHLKYNLNVNKIVVNREAKIIILYLLILLLVQYSVFFT